MFHCLAPAIRSNLTVPTVRFTIQRKASSPFLKFLLSRLQSLFLLTSQYRLSPSITKQEAFLSLPFTLVCSPSFSIHPCLLFLSFSIFRHWPNQNREAKYLRTFKINQFFFPRKNPKRAWFIDRYWWVLLILKRENLHSFCLVCNLCNLFVIA